MKKREKRPLSMREAHRRCQMLMCVCGVLEVIGFLLVDLVSLWFILAWMVPTAVVLGIAYKLDEKYVRCPHCHYPLSTAGPGEAPELGRFCPSCGKELPR